MHVWAPENARGSSSFCLLQHYFLQHSKRVWSLPPARPTASLIHTVSQSVFSGASTSFLAQPDSSVLEVGTGGKEMASVSA